MYASSLYQSATDRIRRKGLTIAVLVLATSLAACSSAKPRLGDTIRAQGVELSAIGDQWSEGDDLQDEGREQIEDGQDMIAKGRKLVSRGEALVEEGQDNVKRGQQMKQTAESTYRSRTGVDLPVAE